MNDRTKTLWLPGLAVFAASMLWMLVLQRFNVPVRTPWAHSGLPAPIYLVWLLPQAFFGAMGAFLSRRGGGGRKMQLAAGVFPSIVLFVIVCCVILFGTFVERDPHILQQPLNIALTFLTWVAIPAVALLCGALLFCRRESAAS